MRVFALELNNDIRGLEERKAYIEGLIARLPSPELVVLPELALCGFIPNQYIWPYADDKGKDTTEWALRMAIKYNTHIGVGYADREHKDFYNRYMIVGPKGVCGVATQSEGVSAVFKRGVDREGRVALAGLEALDIGREHKESGSVPRRRETVAGLAGALPVLVVAGLAEVLPPVPLEEGVEAGLVGVERIARSFVERRSGRRVRPRRLYQGLSFALSFVEASSGAEKHTSLLGRDRRHRSERALHEVVARRWRTQEEPAVRPRLDQGRELLVS